MMEIAIQIQTNLETIYDSLNVIDYISERAPGSSLEHKLKAYQFVATMEAWLKIIRTNVAVLIEYILKNWEIIKRGLRGYDRDSQEWKWYEIEGARIIEALRYRQSTNFYAENMELELEEASSMTLESPKVSPMKMGSPGASPMRITTVAKPRLSMTTEETLEASPMTQSVKRGSASRMIIT